MSLREELIEAGAARVWNELPRYDLMYPECERTVRLALDAFIDKLTDEAFEENPTDPHLEGISLADFIALSGLSGLIAILRSEEPS